MQFSVTFRHMEPTDALKHYARERMDRIKKYFPDPISCHVVMSTFRFNHRVDVSLKLHNGLQVGGHEVTEDMYSSLDLVSAKIERQVRKYKDKLRDHRTRHDLPPVSIAHSVLEEREGAEAAEQNSAMPQVVRRESFDANPMTVAGAMMQLNLLHRDFLVFLNEETGSVNVIYRRKDEEYGLIEAGNGN